MTEIEGKVAETYAQSSPTLPDHVLNGTPTERDAWDLEQRGLIRLRVLATFQPDLPASGHDAHVGISASASDDGDEESTAKPPAKPPAEEDEEDEEDEDDGDSDEVDSEKVANDIKDANVGGSAGGGDDGDEGPLGTAEPPAKPPAEPPAEDLPRQPAPADDPPAAEKGAKPSDAYVGGSAGDGDEDDEDDKVKKQKREKKKARQLARQSPAEKKEKKKVRMKCITDSGGHYFFNEDGEKKFFDSSTRGRYVLDGTLMATTNEFGLCDGRFDSQQQQRRPVLVLRGHRDHPRRRHVRRAVQQGLPRATREAFSDSHGGSSQG